MGRPTIGRRGYVLLVAAGLAGIAAGSGTREAGNYVDVFVRGEEATVTLTVERRPDGERLFRKTVTFSPLLYPEDGPNERYENAFDRGRVRIRFDVQGGPENALDVTDDGHVEGVTVYYTSGSITFDVDETPY